MNDVQSLSHARWECKYHVVWIPKYRRKTLYGELRKDLGEVLHELARQKESKVLEGHLQPDHIRASCKMKEAAVSSKFYNNTLK